MNENYIEKKEQVIYIFNNNKEDINMQIQKSFISYLKDTIKIDKKIEELNKQLYNLSSR